MAATFTGAQLLRPARPARREWVCAQCTFVNVGAVSMCGMCQRQAKPSATTTKPRAMSTAASNVAKTGTKRKCMNLSSGATRVRKTAATINVRKSGIKRKTSNAFPASLAEPPRTMQRQWFCTQCTFINMGALSRCGMCQAKRSAQIPPVTKASQFTGGHELPQLSDCKFLLTGTLSVSKARMATEIEVHGGCVVRGIRRATHLLHGDHGGPGIVQHTQAVQKSIPVVNETWVRALFTAADAAMAPAGASSSGLVARQSGGRNVPESHANQNTKQLRLGRTRSAPLARSPSGF